MKNLISVIVPVYNSEKYLSTCLEHILAQSFKNIEVIVIDDGSTDNSRKILDSFAKEDRRVTCVSQKNMGVSHARNRGINLAHGNYIYFCDSDDYIDEDSFSDLLANARQNTLVGQTISMDGNVHPIFPDLPGEWNSIFFLQRIMQYKTMGSCWRFLFESKIAKSIAFDEEIKFMEDTVFLSKYLQNVDCVKLIDSSSYHYRLHSSSSSHGRNNFEKISHYKTSHQKIDEITNQKIHEDVWRHYRKLRKGEIHSLIKRLLRIQQKW